MTCSNLAVILLFGALAAAQPAPAPRVAIGQAQIPLRPGVVSATLPAGLRFLAAEQLRSAGPIQGGDALLGAFAATAEGDDVVVSVVWVDDGHVAETDARALDADAVMAQLRATAAQGNQVRRQAGRAEVEVLGFVEPPRYDAKERVLTFVWRGREGAQTRVSYEARKLTRGGAVACTGVGSEAALARVATATNAVLAGLRVEAGHRYDDFVAGDPESKWAQTKQVALGVWERLSTWQKVLAGCLALSALLAVLKGVRRLFGG